MGTVKPEEPFFSYVCYRFKRGEADQEALLYY